MLHHGIQSPHGWELLSVQLSSIVTVPASKPAKISLDVQMFPQITWAISICTTTRELVQGEQFPSAYASLGMPKEQPGTLACVCW